jgi:hypothetical protein
MAPEFIPVYLINNKDIAFRPIDRDEFIVRNPIPAGTIGSRCAAAGGRETAHSVVD